ncbi:MAG: protein kinase [Jiangellaceae bacterium]
MLHSVAVGMATALAAIHGVGVIHRDLKPQNVLFSLGTPKVIDFGIARALEVTSRRRSADLGVQAHQVAGREGGWPGRGHHHQRRAHHADQDRQLLTPVSMRGRGSIVPTKIKAV